MIIAFGLAVCRVAGADESTNAVEMEAALERVGESEIAAARAESGGVVSAESKKTPRNMSKILDDDEANQQAAMALDDDAAGPNPKLRPGFLLDIEVSASGAPEFQEKAKRITQEGTITLPLLGSVAAAGMTLMEFSGSLTEALKRYLREPEVEVSFVLGPDSISPWGYVTVIGRVTRPGRVNMPPTGDLSVSEAIQKAGGLAASAKDTGIIVVRKDPATKGVERVKVNLRDVAKRGEEADIKLRAGDVLYVPVRMF